MHGAHHPAPTLHAPAGPPLRNTEGGCPCPRPLPGPACAQVPLPVFWSRENPRGAESPSGCHGASFTPKARPTDTSGKLQELAEHGLQPEPAAPASVWPRPQPRSAPQGDPLGLGAVPPCSHPATSISLAFQILDNQLPRFRYGIMDVLAWFSPVWPDCSRSIGLADPRHLADMTERKKRVPCAEDAPLSCTPCGSPSLDARSTPSAPAHTPRQAASPSSFSKSFVYLV